MSLVPALITPSLLIWARETSGYNIAEVAGKLHVPPDRIVKWESGESQPTITQAKKLATIYNRSLAVFYLPYPPGTASPPPDYRRFSSVSEGLGPRLRYEIRKALYRREIAVQILEERKELPPAFALGASMEEPSALVAKRLRDALSLSIDDQKKWKTPNQAFKEWIYALEKLGVLVFQTQGGVWGVTEDEMWGASIYEPLFPIVVINGRLSPTAKIFTLMHEYTHLALRTSGICDMDEREQVEVFCNRVAGEILVPASDLLDVWSHLSINEEPADDQIKMLAKRYSVSHEAVVRRLLILGQVSKEFYQTKRDQYLQEISDIREARKANKKPIRVCQSTLILRRNGFRYTGIILDAYHSSVISLGQVSRYLDMNLKHFDRVQDVMMASM